MTAANYDEVICPNCVTQFRAIPVNVQNELTALKAELARPESTAVSLMRAENVALRRQVEELTPDALNYRDFMAALARGEDRS